MSLNSETIRSTILILDKDGANYLVWKERMTNKLIAQALYPIVLNPSPVTFHTAGFDAEHAFSNEATDDEKKAIKDSKAKSIIMEAISVSLHTDIGDTQTACHLWRELQRRFYRTGVTEIGQLTAKLVLMRVEDSDDIEVAVREICRTIDKLAALGSPLTELQKISALQTNLPESYQLMINTTIGAIPNSTFQSLCNLVIENHKVRDARKRLND